MSHFTKVKTQLTETETLKQAMAAALRWPVRENATVRGYNGNAASARLVAVNPNAAYDVGAIWQEQEGHYELVADFYGLRPMTDESLLRDVSQQYALSILRQESQIGGYTMSEPIFDEDGAIRVVLEQW